MEPDAEYPPLSEIIKEKHTGALLGLAIGDALGMPLEFLTNAEILRRYHGPVTHFENPHPDHPNASLQAGQYTDDTQLALLVVETLLAKRGFNAVDYKQRFLKAKNDLRSIGRTTRHALARIERGLPETGDPESLGCGPLVRGVPLGLWYTMTHQEGAGLIADAVDAAKVTHGHPLVTSLTALVACQIAYLKDESPSNFSTEDLLDFSYRILELISCIERRDSRGEMKTVLDYVKENLNQTPSRMQRMVSTTGNVSDVMRIALYSFLRNHQSFADTVTCAVMFGGDADSYGALAGAYSGALLGEKGIPERYDNIENRATLREKSQQLYHRRERLVTNTV